MNTVDYRRPITKGPKRLRCSQGRRKQSAIQPYYDLIARPNSSDRSIGNLESAGVSSQDRRFPGPPLPRNHVEEAPISTACVNLSHLHFMLNGCEFCMKAHACGGRALV